MDKVTVLTIEEQGYEEGRKFNENPSGLPFIRNTESGGKFGSTLLPIVKKISTDIQMSSDVTNYLYTITHNLNRRCDFFGRYKRELVVGSGNFGNWTTLQNETIPDTSDREGVLVNSINKNDLVLYINFDVGVYPKLRIEIYFIDFEI